MRAWLSQIGQKSAHVRDLVNGERNEDGRGLGSRGAAILAKPITAELARVVAVELVDDAADLLARAALPALRTGHGGVQKVSCRTKRVRNFEHTCVP